MRRAERPLTQSLRVRIEQPRDGPDDRYLQALVLVERRQQARDGMCQEGLAGPRRSQQQQVVPACDGHLQRPPCVRLAAHLPQIDRLDPLQERWRRLGLAPFSPTGDREVVPQRRRTGCPAPWSRDQARRVRQVGDAERLDALDHPGLAEVPDRDDDAPVAGTRQRRQHGQGAADRPDRARQ
jgi:hypothetical protein